MRLGREAQAHVVEEEVVGRGVRACRDRDATAGRGGAHLVRDHVRLCFPAEPHLLEEAVRRMRLAWEDVQSADVLTAAV